MADKEKPKKRTESKPSKRKDECGGAKKEPRAGDAEPSVGLERGESETRKKEVIDPIQKRERKAKELCTRKLAELTEAFHLFDFDRDGIISFSDLKKVYASLDGDIDEEEIKQMIAEGLSPLDFDAFVKLMGYKTLELDDEEVLIEALSQWDYGTGLISVERIRHDLMTWGDRFTEEEAAAALEQAPIVLTEKKEKMINYVQFSNDLCGFRKAKNLLKGK